jgi:hypothetical protein
MKILCWQLQPGRDPSVDPTAAVDRLRRIAKHHAIGNAVHATEGYDEGRYINVSFESADVVRLWMALKEELGNDSALANVSTICCQGDDGWNDYLLLHHFDATQMLDRIA